MTPFQFVWQSVLVTTVLTYALIVTGLMVLFIFGRPKTRSNNAGESRRWFSPGEFAVGCLYRFANLTRAVASGADSFLMEYREIRSEELRVRARINSR